MIATSQQVIILTHDMWSMEHLVQHITLHSMHRKY